MCIWLVRKSESGLIVATPLISFGSRQCSSRIVMQKHRVPTFISANMRNSHIQTKCLWMVLVGGGGGVKCCSMSCKSHAKHHMRRERKSHARKSWRLKSHCPGGPFVLQSTFACIMFLKLLPCNPFCWQDTVKHTAAWRVTAESHTKFPNTCALNTPSESAANCGKSVQVCRTGHLCAVWPSLTRRVSRRGVGATSEI